MISYPLSWVITAVLLIGIYAFYRKHIKPLALRL